MPAKSANKRRSRVLDIIPALCRYFSGVSSGLGQGASMTSELDPRAAGARRLKSKVCIVTGAGQGIGRATAKRLGEEGGTIVIADRIAEGAARTLAELKAHGVEARTVVVDLGSFAGAQALMTKTVEAYGRID